MFNIQLKNPFKLLFILSSLLISGNLLAQKNSEPNDSKSKVQKRSKFQQKRKELALIKEERKSVSYQNQVELGMSQRELNQLVERRKKIEGKIKLQNRILNKESKDINVEEGEKAKRLAQLNTLRKKLSSFSETLFSKNSQKIKKRMEASFKDLSVGLENLSSVYSSIHSEKEFLGIEFKIYQDFNYQEVNYQDVNDKAGKNLKKINGAYKQFRIQEKAVFLVPTDLKDKSKKCLGLFREFQNNQILGTEQSCETLNKLMNEFEKMGVAEVEELKFPEGFLKQLKMPKEKETK